MQKGFPKLPEGHTGIKAAAFAVQRELDEQHPAPKARPIEEVLLTYDMSHIKLPMAELDLLWRFVIGVGADSKACVDELPLLLDGTINAKNGRTSFLVLWSVARDREGYNKKHWKLLRQQLFLYGVML